MEVQVNRKTMKIIIAVLIIVAIVIGGIFAAKFISVGVKINETRKKLAQIDAKELEEKIIEELEDSDLNFDKIVSDRNLEAKTGFIEGVNFEGYISGATVCIKNGEIIAGVEYPCFKITSDDNGNFESIEYSETIFQSDIIEKIIEKVLKDEYSIDMKIIGNERYNKKFNKYLRDFNYTNKGNIYYTDKNFLLGLIGEINENAEYEYGDNLPSVYKEYRTVTFGNI